MKSVAGAALVAIASSGLAADHLNLEENIPVRVEDAFVTPFNSIEAQAYTSYDYTTRDLEGDNRFTLVPRLEAGVLRNMQLSVAVPYRIGDAEDTKSGNVRVEALYNLSAEDLHVPAVSLGAVADQPFGSGRGGFEASARFVLTKSIGSIGRSYLPRRVHLNADYTFNTDPRTEERRHRYLVGIAYSQPLTNELVVVGDFYRTTRREEGSAENMFELGVRYALDPLTVLSASVGAGVADDSPDLRVLAGVQRTLTWPWRRP